MDSKDNFVWIFTQSLRSYISRSARNLTLIDHKKIGIKHFKRSKFKEAIFYFSLAYEKTQDKNLLFLIQICSLGEKNAEEAKLLFDYFMDKLRAGEDDEGMDEILKILESRLASDEYFEEQDAISYEDFKKAVYKDGSFKKVFENIMFSTKVMISNKDDFLEFLENLIKNDFIEMSINYLESAAVMFGGDERIDQLFREIQKRQNNENISRK